MLYTPGRVASAPREEIRADLARVRRELAPCDVVLADIPWDTPDEMVNLFVETCRSLEGVHEETFTS